MTEVLQLPTAAACGKPAGKWSTIACQCIIELIEETRAMRQFALATGPSGRGKTTAARMAVEMAEAAEDGRATFYATMTKATATLQPGLHRIAASMNLHISSHVSAYEVHKIIVDNMLNSKTVLVIDEAQFMSDDLLHGIRNVWDDLNLAGRPMGIVLIGTSDLDARIDGKNRRNGALEPLAGRIGARISIDPVSADDVAAICRHHGLASAHVEKLVLHVATRPGGLHNVERLLRQAGELAGDGKPIGLSHLKEAAALAGVAS